MEEGVDAADMFDAEMIRSCSEQVRELGEQANESYENMPEGLQGGRHRSASVRARRALRDHGR